MQSMSFTMLLTAFLVLCIFNSCDGVNFCALPCPNCSNYTQCEHGSYTDFCDRKVCAKGPGQRCGGPLEVTGKCGDGMTCNSSCGRCTGCSWYTGVCATSESYFCTN